MASLVYVCVSLTWVIRALIGGGSGKLLPIAIDRDIAKILRALRKIKKNPWTMI